MFRPFLALCALALSVMLVSSVQANERFWNYKKHPIKQNSYYIKHMGALENLPEIERRAAIALVNIRYTDMINSLLSKFAEMPDGVEAYMQMLFGGACMQAVLADDLQWESMRQVHSMACVTVGTHLQGGADISLTQEILREIKKEATPLLSSIPQSVLIKVADAHKDNLTELSAAAFAFGTFGVKNSERLLQNKQSEK